MAQIEEMWGHLAALFEEIEANDGWGQKHGPDWTFADLPYHLAYMNREVAARGIEMGSDHPEAEQNLITTTEELGAWNESKFAERSAGQSPADSVAMWRASCEQIRTLTAPMQDSDLDNSIWWPLLLGWTTIRVGLDFVRDHDYVEFMQLRIHMGRHEPLPSSAATKNFLESIMRSLPLILNREAAAGEHFIAVMTFTDPGVGSFTIEVSDDAAGVKTGGAADADLIMTQSAEAFVKTMKGMHNPAEAMQSGEIQVSDFESLAKFGNLFPTA
jgi:putative sterol carrier protein